MKNLFNRNFYRFTIGFAGILIASFALAAVVTHLDSVEDISAAVQTSDQ